MPLGAIIAEADPGWRDAGTWIVLQVRIACAPEATVWYEMTHGVLPHASTFSDDDAVEALLNRPAVQAGSLDNARADFRHYVAALTEDAALGGLRLLSALNLPGGTRYRRAAPAVVPPLALAWALYDYRTRAASGTRSMSLDAIVGPSGVGRALHLQTDLDGFADRIRPLRSLDVLAYTQSSWAPRCRVFAARRRPARLHSGILRRMSPNRPISFDQAAQRLVGSSPALPCWCRLLAAPRACRRCRRARWRPPRPANSGRARRPGLV